MRQQVWVVTDSDLGWDCIVDVFDNEEAAKRCAESRQDTGHYGSHRVYSSADEEY